ncbi:hypothetical protein [Rhizobium sp. MHM7A]|uniref:hypothetical protein n=1 Tax=Rhizobium sp. MHM7A TaxID=2583233 RepID=UPI001105DAC4|nr:hypothetical protein [Rhizobium sp. MHM7A]TLX15994.1 hypothetical protein FFR93_01365 [Rhizobium sp. MHM7A]
MTQTQSKPVNAEWRTLLDAIKEMIEEHGIEKSVVFHGTSTKWLKNIQEDGLCPTELGDAYFKKRIDYDDPDFGPEGSFWGQLSTAAWYAEDTVAERDNGETQPILIVADAFELSLEYPLYPDRASLEGPVDQSLPVSTDEKLADTWWKRGARFNWERGLEELGAIFAVHTDYLDNDKIGIVQDIEDFRNFLVAKNLISEPAMVLG